MKIDCISDLHGYKPELEGGDLLLVAGDLMAHSTQKDFNEFCEWIKQQNYECKVVIAGNHDGLLVDYPYRYIGDAHYLCDSGIEYNGLKIWGTPWTKTFHGMNPLCMAFTCSTETLLREKFQHIPKDTNILITHTPSYGCLDMVRDRITGQERHEGSTALSKYENWDEGLLLHVFGHIHEGYGEYKESNLIFRTHSVNGSIMNKYYIPENKPIRVII